VIYITGHLCPETISQTTVLRNYFSENISLESISLKIFPLKEFL